MNAYEQKQEERRQRYLELAAKKHFEAQNLRSTKGSWVFRYQNSQMLDLQK